jgi:hypothetical protein
VVNNGKFLSAHILKIPTNVALHKTNITDGGGSCQALFAALQQYISAVTGINKNARIIK